MEEPSEVIKEDMEEPSEVIIEDMEEPSEVIIEDMEEPSEVIREDMEEPSDAIGANQAHSGAIGANQAHSGALRRCLLQSIVISVSSMTIKLIKAVLELHSHRSSAFSSSVSSQGHHRQSRSSVAIDFIHTEAPPSPRL